MSFNPHPQPWVSSIIRLGEPHFVRPPVTLNLPNLQFQDWRLDPIQIHQVGLGSGPQFAPDIEVLVHFANTGRRDSGPFLIVAEVMINLSGVSGDGEHRISIDNLPAGALDTRQITVLTNIPQGLFIGVSAQVWLDRPTPDRAWGQVMESDETDNNGSAFLGFPPYFVPPDGP